MGMASHCRSGGVRFFARIFGIVCAARHLALLPLSAVDGVSNGMAASCDELSSRPGECSNTIDAMDAQEAPMLDKNIQNPALTEMPRHVVVAPPALRWTQGSKYVYANLKCAPDFDQSTVLAPCEVEQVRFETKGLIVSFLTTTSLESSGRSGVPKMTGGNLPQEVTQFLLNFRPWGKIDAGESSWKRDKSGTGLTLKLRKAVRGQTWQNIAEAEPPPRVAAAGATDKQGADPKSTSGTPLPQQWPQHVEVWQGMQTKLEEAREKAREKNSRRGEAGKSEQGHHRKTTGAAGGRKAHGSGAENKNVGDEEEAPHSIWETEGLKQQFEKLAAEHEMTANGKKLGAPELLDILRGWMPWRWDWGGGDSGVVGDDGWSEDDEDQDDANKNSLEGETDWGEHHHANANSWERRGSRRRISSARRRRLTEKSTDADGSEQWIGQRSIVVVVAIIVFGAMLVVASRGSRHRV